MDSHLKLIEEARREIDGEEVKNKRMEVIQKWKDILQGKDSKHIQTRDSGTNYDLDFLTQHLPRFQSKEKIKYKIFTPTQIDYLKEEFIKQPRWTRKKMREISESLGGISVTKIYKWNWDRHKRVFKGLPLTRDEDIMMRNTNETPVISSGCQTEISGEKKN